MAEMEKAAVRGALTGLWKTSGEAFSKAPEQPSPTISCLTISSGSILFAPSAIGRLFADEQPTATSRA